MIIANVVKVIYRRIQFLVRPHVLAKFQNTNYGNHNKQMIH